MHPDYSISEVQAIRRLTFFIVCLGVFISTRASGLALSDVTLGVYLSMIIVTYVAFGFRPTNGIAWLALGLGAVILQNYIALGAQFELFKYVKLFFLYFSSVLICQIGGGSIFFYLIRIGKLLVLASVPFYLWQLIDAESLHQVGLAINDALPQLLEARGELNDQSSNILIYNIEFAEPWRNSGVFWEPGGFGYFLSLCLLFHVAASNGKRDATYWTLLIGIISSFSTTAYLLAIVIILTDFVIRTFKSKSISEFSWRLALSVFVFGVASWLFYSSDIFYGKIETEISNQISYVNDQPSTVYSIKSLGRFGSMILDLQSIRDQPIFGKGYSESSFTNEYSNYIFTNGLTSFIRGFGVIGLFWLLWSVLSSGRSISRNLKIDWPLQVVLPIVVLILSFSNPVLLSPILLMLQTFFIPNHHKLFSI